MLNLIIQIGILAEKTGNMIKLAAFDMDGVLFEHFNFWYELHKRFGTYKKGKELTEKYKNERKLTHYSADYRERHKEEIRGHLLNGFREYHRKNRDSIMARKKAYYALNRIKILDRMKVYYLNKKNKAILLNSENKGFEACSPEIPNKEPTFALSEVLNK